jgi:hypothetical protein
MAKRVEIDQIEGKNPEELCAALESGDILFFQKIPFSFPKEDLDFLLEQKQTGAKNRKNIAYKPQLDAITNADSTQPEKRQRLHEIMKFFSQQSTAFVKKNLVPYASSIRTDYASFRPFQEKGRKLRKRAMNDLLHVDAFPTRPMFDGTRIMRLFININPHEPRVWHTSDDFSHLIERFGGTKELPFPKSAQSKSYMRKEKLIKLMQKMGLKKVLRSPYDHFMLNMHHFMKENDEFQKNAPIDRWEFPPFSCWIVFTDYVSHAALSGQYALEQTFLLPRQSQVNPEKSPLSILEMHAKEIMAHPLLSRG